uniref:Uncharacterized protein n=1 Tax=viral metagenome TaxID=1070528 RepID=A0A6C0ES61_9ZZZZ
MKIKTKKYKSKNRKKERKRNKTLKNIHHIIPNNTPLQIRKISNDINRIRKMSSYSPTINKDLVTLKSIPRKEILDCNISQAYSLKEPLQIGIPGNIFGKNCFNYNTPQAKKYLLRNLSADKHIDITKIVPPLQVQSNCWFNAMFVTFFVSDKGRKFFHFLRQLMIEGKQQNGTIIPDKLKNAFALLNFGIDACLTGNKFAYELNTNNIIHQLYKSIPSSYKEKYPYIVDVDAAGNPLLYYMSIINYLNNSSIVLLFIRDADNNWKDKVSESMKKMTHLPHIIVLEVYDEKASKFNKKPLSFTINESKYKIDSSVVRDISKQHFCATITCEKKDMGYDGMSFHRISDLKWKDKMNSDYNWSFEGSTDYDGTLLKWNFTKCYQLLLYYRFV